MMVFTRNMQANDSLIPAPQWFVYILRCADQSLYTGITTNLSRRLDEHNDSSKGARYTRGRRPVVLIYSESQPNRATASQREYAIKQLSRSEKEQLLSTNA